MTIHVYGPASERQNTYTKKVYPLGTELHLEDGRKYRFGRIGATDAAKGKLYQMEVPDGNFDTLAIPSSTLNVAGSRSLRVTLPASAIVKDLWADGWVTIEAAAGAGFGHTFQVDSNPASSGSEDITVTLKPGNGLVELLNTSDKATFLKHAMADIIIHPAPPTAMVVGVPNVTITTAQYGWIQFRGPCAVLVVGTHVIAGGIIAASTVTGSPDGAVEAAGTAITTTAATIAQITELTGSLIGVCMEVAPTTGYGTVDLRL